MVALHAYRLRTGGSAVSLGALVDEGIVGSIPKDLFTGKALRYSAARRVVWTPGPDGMETGDSAFDEDGFRNTCVWVVWGVR